MNQRRRAFASAVFVLLLLGALVGVYARLRVLQAENRPAAATAGVDPAVERADPGRAVAIPVTWAPVRRDALVLSVSAHGRAQAAARARLAAEVEGWIDEVGVREGDAVRAGQVIARIDPERYALEVERARARLEKAEAAFRELTLFDDEMEDGVLRAERRRMARARSGLTEAEVALREAELDMDRATVRAPFAGAVANLAVAAGERVMPRDSIAEIVDLSRIRIEVHVLETEVPDLVVGREARVALSAFPDRTLPGHVKSINPVIDPRSRSARVTVTLPNPTLAVRPGMHARVRIAARLFPDRVIVPREAILERDGRTLVFLFEPTEPQGRSGFARWIYVTTGLENERFVELVPGDATAVPTPGSIVLTGGHYTLVHDARVRLVEGDGETADASS